MSIIATVIMALPLQRLLRSAHMSLGRRSQLHLETLSATRQARAALTLYKVRKAKVDEILAKDGVTMES